MAFDRIAVVGAGAWGTRARECDRARGPRGAARHAATAPAPMRIVQAGARARGLPGVRLDERVGIAPVGADGRALRRHPAGGAVAAPARGRRPRSRRRSRAGTPVIACAKGIERGTHQFMTEVIAESAPAALPAILSGPSFAADVARGLPAAVTLAARDETVAAALARALGSATLRPYHSTDVRGVEIGGAAKNVLAIAAGIVAGRGLGASAAAALVTRGFAELFRFGRAFGARPGDLDRAVRARRSDSHLLERAVAQLLLRHRARPGRSGAAAGGELAEGIFTAPVLVEMANEKGVEMPIATAVVAILDGRTSVDEAIETLMTRPFRAEG